MVAGRFGVFGIFDDFLWVFLVVYPRFLMVVHVFSPRSLRVFHVFFYNFCFNQWLAEGLQYWPLVRSEGLAYVRTPPWDSLTGLPIHLI